MVDCRSGADQENGVVGIVFPACGINEQEGDDMSEEHWTAFVVLLAAVSVPSVSLLYVLAWELWRYAKRAEQ